VFRVLLALAAPFVAAALQKKLAPKPTYLCQAKRQPDQAKLQRAVGAFIVAAERDPTPEECEQLDAAIAFAATPERAALRLVQEIKTGPNYYTGPR